MNRGLRFMTRNDKNTAEQLDLIWGCEEMAKFIGRSQRSVLRMLDNGELPAKKVGGRWVAERGALTAVFTQPEKAQNRSTK
jgi:excisionase family DNA binding protein